VASAPRGKLHQVVMNLLVNAMQALGDNGPAGERDPRAHRDRRQGVGAQRLGHGCGIPEEAQERIFEPFFTTKPVGIGTGIGLSVCQAVVQKLGGRISVRSKVGQGTTFEVRVPTEPVATAEEPQVQKVSA
jgi:signal transduction histidine kinase